MKRWSLGFLFVAVAACGPPRDPASAGGERPGSTAGAVRFDWDSMPAGDPGAPAGAPISLTTPEGVRLGLIGLRAGVVVEDPLAFTELHFIFKNPEPRQIEGRFEMTLPPGAAVSRFAMRIGDAMQEGEVVELERATQVYEGFLHRRVDPALLQKHPGSRFQARVFPIFPNEEKEIILSYSQELGRSDEPYRLRLLGLPRLDTFDLRVFLGSQAASEAPSPLAQLELHKEAFKPDRDLVIPLAREGEREGGGRALRHGSKVIARVTPVLDAKEAPVDGLLVLFDTSASMAFGFGAQVDWLGAFLQSLREKVSPGSALRIACFDQDVAEVYVGPFSGLTPAALQKIRDRRPLGASNLDKALTYAAQAGSVGPKYNRILLISDGIASVGASEPAELIDRAAKIGPTGMGRLDAVALGEARDAALLHSLAASALPNAGVVLDNAPAPKDALARLTKASFKGITVSVPGARWVWPSDLRGVQPGEQVLVYADVPEGRPFEIALGGDHAGRRAVPLAPATSGVLMERAHAHAQIRDLSARYAAARDAGAKEALRGQIVAVSTSKRVLSDFTGLLVLETENDYQRFNINRDALADILTVGPRGLDLLNRSDAKPLAVAGSGPPTGLAPAISGSPPRPSFAPTPGQGSARPTSSPPASSPPAASPPALSPPVPPPVPPPKPPSLVVLTDTEIIILQQIHFDGGLANIKPISYPLLDNVAQVLDEYEQITKLEIQGHTDNRGSKAQNRLVSQRRADAVKAHLVKLGVEPERLVARGYGGDLPLAENSSERGRALNRRVQFRILERERYESRDLWSRRRSAAYFYWQPPSMSAHEGTFREITELLRNGPVAEAVTKAEAWRAADPADALAVIALGNALAKQGELPQAMRAYGSLIDLYPGRADLRRAAGVWLEQLAERAPGALDLAIDTYRRALALRPDHPTSHTHLAFALARAGRLEEAFSVVESAVGRQFNQTVFRDVEDILRDDLGILGYSWMKAEPRRAASIEARVQAARAAVRSEPFVRFVMSWETDASTVSMGVRAASEPSLLKRAPRQLPTILTSDGWPAGYGPTAFTVVRPPDGALYQVQARYTSRGAMGHAIGRVHIITHDGGGKLSFEERPFVIMNEGGGVDLGVVTAKNAVVAAPPAPPN